MFNPLVIILGVLAVVGVSLGVFSLRRRTKVRALCSEAAEAIQHGDHEKARRILLIAERNWSWSSHDGSRTSHLTDLAALTQILDLLSRVPSPPGALDCITRVESAAAELRAFFSDRANFGMDGRSMKREATVRWLGLSDRFEALRQELRKNYEVTTSVA